VAKRFFFISAGIFMLALAYHLGASSATAQVGSAITGCSFGSGPGEWCVMTANGDVYVRGGICTSCPGSMDNSPPAVRVGNFWGGLGPTPATRESFGQLKVKYRP
jgi:hypothetical protein